MSRTFSATCPSLLILTGTMTVLPLTISDGPKEETMKATSVLVVSCALVLGSGLSPASPGESPFPRHPTFTTQALTPLAIEGLTGDASGNLYTTGRAAPPALCPVWKISGPPIPTASGATTHLGPPARSTQERGTRGGKSRAWTRT